jgi:cytochrome P450
LLQSEQYKDDVEGLADEIIQFFIAGIITQMISSTNLIYYITRHPEFKSKLLAEILLPIAAVKDDIVERLEFDTVMGFDYFKACYNESMRIEPPLSKFINTQFAQTTEISFGDD